MKYKNTVENLIERLDRSTDCWLFTGGLSTKGYAQVSYHGKLVTLHVLVYEALVGPVPEGLVLDHLCRRPNCANPAHLEPVTHQQNILRGEGIAAQRVLQTHCVNGHPFDEANTYFREGKYRTCRACRNKHVKAWYDRGKRPKNKEETDGRE